VGEDPQPAERLEQAIGVAGDRVFPGPTGQGEAGEQDGVTADSVAIRLGDRGVRPERLPDDALHLDVADITALELRSPLRE
jgi:hypothetical protein